MSEMIRFGSLPVDVFEYILGDKLDKYDKVEVCKMLADDFMEAAESQLWDFLHDDLYELERGGSLDEFIVQDERES